MKKNLYAILAGIVMTTLVFTACGSGAGQTQAPAKEERPASGPPPEKTNLREK